MAGSRRNSSSHNDDDTGCDGCPKIAGGKATRNKTKQESFAKSHRDNDLHPAGEDGQGIPMAAHHLISCSAVKELSIIKKLEHKGYDINRGDNLVMIPRTLIGACHLKCQVHKGNHGNAYKDEVKSLLQDIKQGLHNGKYCNSTNTKLSNDMKDISSEICNRLNLFSLPLIEGTNYFKPKRKHGCKDVTTDEIDDLRLLTNRNHCSKGRDHAEYLNIDNSIIPRGLDGQYMLAPGN